MKFKNISWAIAGLAMKPTKGHNRKHKRHFNSSSTGRQYVDKKIHAFTISFSTTKRTFIHKVCTSVL